MDGGLSHSWFRVPCFGSSRVYRFCSTWCLTNRQRLLVDILYTCWNAWLTCYIGSDLDDGSDDSIGNKGSKQNNDAKIGLYEFILAFLGYCLDLRI